MLYSRLFGLLALAACATVTSAQPTAAAAAQVILVSQTNSAAQFKTIVEAVASVQATVGAVEIQVEAGVYVGVVAVTRAAPLTIRAVGEVTITQAAGAASSSFQQNQLVQQTTSSSQTSTLVVTGSSDFKLYGCTVESPQPAAPAVSIVSGTASFYSASFQAQQQTIFVAEAARAYARDCDIRGASDFVTGAGTFYIDRSRLYATGSGSVVAWGGAGGATGPTSGAGRFAGGATGLIGGGSGGAVQTAKRGCYVVDSKLDGDTPQSVTLARPLTDTQSADVEALVRAAASTVIYVGVQLGDCVKPQGWSGIQITAQIAARIRGFFESASNGLGRTIPVAGSPSPSWTRTWASSWSSFFSSTSSRSSSSAQVSASIAAFISKQITQRANPNFVEAGCTGAGAANGRQREWGKTVSTSASVRVAASISAVFGSDSSFIDLGGR